MPHGAVERQGDTFTPSPPAPGQGIAAEDDLTLGACGTDVLLCFAWTPPSLPCSLLAFPFNCLPTWDCLLQLWFVCRVHVRALWSAGRVPPHLREDGWFCRDWETHRAPASSWAKSKMETAAVSLPSPAFGFRQITPLNLSAF